MLSLFLLLALAFFTQLDLLVVVGMDGVDATLSIDSPVQVLFFSYFFISFLCYTNTCTQVMGLGREGQGSKDLQGIGFLEKGIDLSRVCFVFPFSASAWGMLRMGKGIRKYTDETPRKTHTQKNKRVSPFSPTNRDSGTNWPWGR